jgi:hypothetical protein
MLTVRAQSELRRGAVVPGHGERRRECGRCPELARSFDPPRSTFLRLDRPGTSRGLAHFFQEE